MSPNEQSPLLDHSTATPCSKDVNFCTNSNLDRSAVLIICTTFLGEFLACVDESLMISTYSAIASEFNGLSDGSWLLVAYNFGFCIASPVYGVLGDLFGRKNLIIVSNFLFALGCIACGLSTSMTQLILARALAGVSGAGMVSLVAVIITDITPTREIAIYQNYSNTMNILGRSLGPPLGGFLTQTVGWRWSFLGQSPLVLVSIIVMVYQMPGSLNRSKQPEDTTWAKLGRVDFTGIISFAVAVLSFFLVVQNFEFGAPQQSRIFYILVAAFLASTIFFLLVENLWAKVPLIPVEMMKTSFGLYCLSQLWVTMSRNAIMPAIVPYFARVHEASDFEASLVTVIPMVGVLIGGTLSGFLIKRTNQYKKMGIVAACVTVLVYLLVFLRWRSGCLLWEALYLFPFGIAIGILFSTQFVGVTTTVPKDRLGQCIGTFYLFQQLGRIIGPLFGLKLIDLNFKSCLQRNLGSRPALIHDILNDVRFSFKLSPSLQAIVRSSYLYGFQFLPLFCALCGVLALPSLILAKG